MSVTVHYFEKAVVLELVERSEWLHVDRTAPSLTLAPSLSTPELVQKQKPLKCKQYAGVVGALKLLAGHYLFLINGREFLGRIDGRDIYQVKKVSMVLVNQQKAAALTENERKMEAVYIKSIKSLLNDRGLYFSYTFDLSHSLQAQSQMSGGSSSMVLRFNKMFFWNKFLSKPFRAKHLYHWPVPLLRGYVHISLVCLGEHSLEFVLISRRSRYRAGSRYLTRGADIEGHVANHVETEQLLGMECDAGMRWTSFTQYRGSIPLLWEQRGFNYRPKPCLYTNAAANAEVFQRHFQDSVSQYGHVTAINLLDERGSEASMRTAFREHVDLLGALQSKIRYVEFDFHSKCRHYQFQNVSELIAMVEDAAQNMGIFAKTGPSVTRTQTGVFRVNCMDCLDRTNLVLSVLGNGALRAQMRDLGVVHPLPDEDLTILDYVFKRGWANNGDAISLQYAGTNALKGDFTRTGKAKVRGKVKDGINSMSRYVINNFLDGFRQVAIELVQGTQVAEKIDIEQMTKPLDDDASDEVPVDAQASSADALQGTFFGRTDVLTF